MLGAVLARKRCVPTLAVASFATLASEIDNQQHKQTPVLATTLCRLRNQNKTKTKYTVFPCIPDQEQAVYDALGARRCCPGARRGLSPSS
eukprot:1087755-Pyramimonas_sp.AAC.1